MGILRGIGKSLTRRVAFGQIASAAQVYLWALFIVVLFALWWFLSSYYENIGYDRHRREIEAKVQVANEDRNIGLALHKQNQIESGMVIEGIEKKGQAQTLADIVEIRQNTRRQNANSSASPPSPVFLDPDSVQLIIDAETSVNRAVRVAGSTRRVQ